MVPSNPAPKLPIPSKYIAPLYPIIQSYAEKSNTLLEIGLGSAQGATLAIRKVWDDRPADPKQLWVSVGTVPPVGAFRPAAKAWKFAYNMVQAHELMAKLMPDLILIDGNYTKAELVEEMKRAFVICTPQTTWLIHDICKRGKSNADMLGGIQDFLGRRKNWRFQLLALHSHGLGALIPL